jgi:hypothetical protein
MTMLKMLGVATLTILLAGSAFAQDHSAHGAHAGHAQQPGQAAGDVHAGHGGDGDDALSRKLIKGYEAKTWETRGELKARKAELDLLMMADSPNTNAVKKLVGEINSLKGKLYETEVLFRLDYKKQTGKDAPNLSGKGEGRKGKMMGGMGCPRMQGGGMKGGMKCPMMQGGHGAHGATDVPEGGEAQAADPHAGH